MNLERIQGNALGDMHILINDKEHIEITELFENILDTMATVQLKNPWKDRTNRLKNTLI